jgi:superfamily II DNA or RNA helicase
MPTGAGKTVCFSDIVYKARKQGTSVLVLCNRIELIEQANGKLKANGLYPTLIVPGYRDCISTLYLGSVDTLRNYSLPDVGLVIIDEAHIRDFDEIVLEYKIRGVHVIGFTATPCRNGKRLLDTESKLAIHYPNYTGQLGDVYDDLLAPVSITELLNGDEEGYTYLVPAITFSAMVDTSKFKIKNTKDGEDFSEADQLKYFNTPRLYAGTVDKYLKHAEGTKAMCYCVNVMASQKQCEEFNSRGIPAVHVDGKIPAKIRKQIFKDFEAGKYKVLCNVAVATTGNDIPTVETIILNRITMSLSLFLQIPGRGARLCPEIGKTHFNFIDMGGNVYRHGRWEFEREWSLDVEIMSRTKGVAPIRECEKCEAIIAANANECKYCGMIQEKKQAEQEAKAKELAEAEFGVIESDHIPKILRVPLHTMTIEQLETYRDLKKYSIAWIVRQLSGRGQQALADYAALKNYSYSWVHKQRQIISNQKEEATDNIWKFIQDNRHLSNEQIIQYALKKLKSSHSPEEIHNLMPKILKAAMDLQAQMAG